MRTARAHFEACLRLAREHGLGVVEMGHVFMPPICAYLADPGPNVRTMADAAVSRARTAGIARAELLALIVAIDIRILAGDAAAAEEAMAAIEILRRRIGSTRFDCEIAYNRARLLMLAGDAAGVRELLPRRVEDVPATTLGYIGAPLLGLAAWAASRLERVSSPDRGRRGGARRGRSSATVTSGSDSTRPRPRSASVDGTSRPPRPPRSRAFTAAEPLGWAELVAERAEFLARLGARDGTPVTPRRPPRLSARLAAADMHALVPALQAAVASPVREF